MPTAKVCRKHGVSSASFYKYKATYGGKDVSETIKVRQASFAHVYRAQSIAQSYEPAKKTNGDDDQSYRPALLAPLGMSGVGCTGQSFVVSERVRTGGPREDILQLR